MLSDRKILITGLTGQIARPMARHLAHDNEVWGVATFYTNFRFTPPAEHLVEVCWGPTCHILGATSIMERCMEDLGLSGEGDTEDGRISLKYNTCLGACSQAPVISVNHRLHGGVTTDKVHQHLASLGDATA